MQFKSVSNNEYVIVSFKAFSSVLFPFPLDELRSKPKGHYDINQLVNADKVNDGGKPDNLVANLIRKCSTTALK